MEDTRNDAPVQADISARLRRLGVHFEILAGLGVGASFEEAAVTCKAGADEIERLRAATHNRVSEYDWTVSKEGPAGLRKREQPAVSDWLVRDKPMGPQFGHLLNRQIDRTFGPLTELRG